MIFNNLDVVIKLSSPGEASGRVLTHDGFVPCRAGWQM